LLSLKVRAPSGRRRSSSQTAEQRERARVQAVARADRIRVLEAELAKSRPQNKKQQEKDIVHFFAEASKLTTLQLMLSQIHFYQHINDRPEPVDLGRSAPACIRSYQELKPVLRFQVGSKEERLFDLENFLVNSGLIFKETNPDDFYQQQREGEVIPEVGGGLDAFNDFFLADLGRDPLQGFYTGMLPFYQMRVAQQGKLYTTGENPAPDWTDLRNPNGRMTFRELGVPAFDDLEHFHDVFEYLMPKAMSKLEPEDFDIFQNVVSVIPKPLGESPAFGEEGFFEYQAALEWVGLTPYFRDKLVAANRDSEKWVGILPLDVFTVLTENKINVDFPAFYSPEPYKQWALRLMYQALTKDDKGPSTVRYLCRPRPNNASYSMSFGMSYGLGSMQNVDTSPRFSQDFCRRGSEDQILSTVVAALAPFEERGPFIPPTLSYSQNLRSIWGDLRPLWDHLRDSGSLNYIPDEQGPVFNELTFVRAQYKMNPWVALRLSVLTKLHELRNHPAPARARGGTHFVGFSG
jgi:hypothetical protein